MIVSDESLSIGGVMGLLLLICFLPDVSLWDILGVIPIMSVGEEEEEREA